MVDSDGSPIEGQQLGLLLYKGGTVCDDNFDDTAAEAICRYMNSSFTALLWTSEKTFDIQNNFDITLDDVQCGSAEWESCRYSEENNCGHSEDVFLSCKPGIYNQTDVLLIKLFRSYKHGVISIS